MCGTTSTLKNGIDNLSLHPGADSPLSVLSGQTHAPEDFHLTRLFVPELHHTLNLADDENRALVELTTSVASEPGVHDLMDTLLSAEDPATWKHCYRVGSLMAATSISLGLGRVETEVACRIGMLHDIGKSHPDVHAAIYNDCSLADNADVFTTIRQHPWYGVSLAMGHDNVSWNVLQGIGNHHALRDNQPYGVFDMNDLVTAPEENGKYPDVRRLISLVGLCDVLDALTVERQLRARPYQSRHSEPFTKEMIMANLDAIQAADSIRQAVVRLTVLGE